MTSAAKSATASRMSSTPAQLTGMIWRGEEEQDQAERAHDCPGRAGPGWLISAPRPASAPSRSRNSISGRATAARMRLPPAHAHGHDVLSGRERRRDRGPVEARDLAALERPRSGRGTSLATRSMSWPSRASLLREGLALHHRLLGQLHVAAAALRLAADVGGGVRGDLLRHHLVHAAPMPDTGCAAPMLVPGAMARHVGDDGDDEIRRTRRARRTDRRTPRPASRAVEHLVDDLPHRACRGRPGCRAAARPAARCAAVGAIDGADTTCAALIACTTPSSSTTGMSARRTGRRREDGERSARRGASGSRRTRGSVTAPIASCQRIPSRASPDGRGDVESGSCLEHSADLRSS